MTTTVTASLKSSKRVRFFDDTTDAGQTHHVASLGATGGDPSDLWYSQRDYIGMKSDARREAQRWRRYRGSGSEMLHNAFRSPSAQAHLNVHVCGAASSDEDDDDKRFCRRGLERYLSRQLLEARCDCKEKARFSVMSLQQQQQDQQMSAMYQQLSRPAVVFAHRMAKADELAARRVANAALTAPSQNPQQPLNLRLPRSSGPLRHSLPAGSTAPLLPPPLSFPAPLSRMQERSNSAGSIDSVDSVDSLMVLTLPRSIHTNRLPPRQPTRHALPPPATAKSAAPRPPRRRRSNDNGLYAAVA